MILELSIFKGNGIICSTLKIISVVSVVVLASDLLICIPRNFCAVGATIFGFFLGRGERQRHPNLYKRAAKTPLRPQNKIFNQREAPWLPL